MKTTQMNGSDILVECLIEQGVDLLFGYPGGSVLNIYDALHKYSDKITHIRTAHEQGAAHAADGYARASGRVGVCLATSGPGATNLVTGIATAYMDSVPMVVLTGNVPRPFLGKDSFQEVDMLGISMPITKHNFIVKDVTKIAETVRAAFRIAQSGRPGPVLIDITKDATGAMADFTPQTPAPILPKTETIRSEDIDAALACIRASKKPLILAGGGLVSGGASDLFLQFVEKMDAPVALSIMGLGGFPSSHPNFTGMIGMHGTRTSNISAQKCDLLIALGTRFSDRVIGNAAQFAHRAKVLHIDIDPAEINKNIKAHYSVVGDLAAILKQLNEKLEPQSHPEWQEDVAALKRTYPLSYPQEGLTPQFVMETINRLTKGEARFSTDVGQHQMFACQFISHEKPRHLITSGGLGTMGFGLGAAIGAKFADPATTVISITGDGCFRMNNIELATAAENNLPLVVVIINNQVLGMVRQWQTLFYEKRYSHTTLPPGPDFVKIAEGNGAVAFSVKERDELEPILKKAIDLQKTVVVNVELGPDEKVFPMLPPGGSIDAFVDED